MAIDFPASPTNGQTFTSGSVTYTWDGTKWTAVAAAGSSNSISQGNTNATVTDTGSDGRFVVTTEGTEALRVDASRRLLVGTSSARNDFYNQTGTGSLVQLEGAGSASTNYILQSWIANHNSASVTPHLVIGKSRGSTNGSVTAVQSGDSLGHIDWHGADGTDMVPAASVECFVDGTPGANDMPGRLVFSTTPDGASSLTNRLWITSLGRSEFRNTDLVYPLTDNAVSLGASAHRWSAVWAVNGTIQTSDQRAKTDITDASLGSEFVKSLRPVSYRWTEGGKEDTGNRDENGDYIYESVPGSRTHWGFIAQEVKEAVDAAGVDFGGWVLTDKDDPSSQQALRYDQFIAPLTKALQEALEKIETLEAKVAALESA